LERNYLSNALAGINTADIMDLREDTHQEKRRERYAVKRIASGSAKPFKEPNTGFIERITQ